MREREQSIRQTIPWPANSMSAGLMQEFSRALQTAVENQRRGTGFGNTLNIRHGDAFSVGSASAPEKFRTHKTLQIMEMEAVLRNDLGELVEVMNAQVTSSAEQTGGMIREAVDKAVELTGNKATFPKDGSPAEAYLEALRMGAWTVVGEGQVKPPFIYFDDQVAEAELERRLAEERQRPEFRMREEEIFKEKSAEAISKERERLSRYQGFGEAVDG